NFSQNGRSYLRCKCRSIKTLCATRICVIAEVRCASAAKAVPVILVSASVAEGLRRRYRATMRFAALAVLVLVTFAQAAASAEAKRPNFVFVLADQWRACATGYAGDPNVKTPNLDRLEAQSVNFTHAISGYPVCSPCRASLLTGQRPITHGVFLNDTHLSDNAVTLPKVMAAAGYDTAMIGKWHLNGRGRLSYIPPENRQGFAYWRAMECMRD